MIRQLILVVLLQSAVIEMVAVPKTLPFDNELKKLDTLSRKQLLKEVLVIFDSLDRVTDRKSKTEFTNYIFELSKNNKPEAHVVALVSKVTYADTANLSLYDEAFKIAEDLDNKDLMMLVEVNRSNYYIEHKSYEKAMFHLLRLLDITSVSGDDEAYRNTLNLLGDIYFRARLYKKATETYTEILNYYNNNQIYNYWRPYTLINNLAQIEMEKGNYDRSLALLMKSRNTADTCLFQPYRNNTIGYTMLKIAEVYLKQHKLDSAEAYIKEVEIMPKNTIYEDVQEELLFQLANLQYYRAKYDSALNNARLLCPSDSSLFTNYLFIPDVYKLIADIYIKKNDYPTAMNFMQKYNRISDSIEVQSNITRSMVLLSTNNYKKTMIDLRNNRRSVVILLVGIILLAIVLFLISFFYRKLYKSNLELVRKSVEKTDLHEECIEGDDKYNPKKQNEDKINKHIEIIIDLKRYMESSKAFLNPKLTILEIADALSTNRTYLSQAISNQLKTSFPVFINEYRIRESIRLIKSGFSDNHTIEALALNCGFASRAVFINAFKKSTGVVPSFFIKNIDKFKNKYGSFF